jgi:hypothetical protein
MSMQNHEETVCFVQKSKRMPTFSWFLASISSYRALTVAVVVPVTMLAVEFAMRTASWAGFVVVMACIFVPAIAVDRRRKKGLRANPYPEPDENHRLSCVAPQGDILKRGALEDVHFEPVVFRSFSYRNLKKPSKALAWVASGLIMVTITYASYGSRLGSLVLRNWLMYLLFVAVPLGVGLVAWLRPVYLRIVPGRLDIMHLSNFRGPSRVEHYDLRQSKILIDLTKSLLFIDDGDRHLEMLMYSVPDRVGLAYHVLLGALSTHQPPSLPDDELVG